MTGHHVAKRSVSCPGCAATAERTDVVRDAPARLRVSVSVRCSRCGHATETDGDVLDADMRAAFYAAEGCWSLRMGDAGSWSVGALRVVRGHMGLGLSELSRMRAARGPLLVGTLAEVERLEAALRAVGADVVTERVPLP